MNALIHLIDFKAIVVLLSASTLPYQGVVQTLQLILLRGGPLAVAVRAGFGKDRGVRFSP